MRKGDFNFDKDSKGGVATKRRTKDEQKTNKRRTKDEQKTNKRRTKDEQKTNKRRCERYGQIMEQ